MRRLLIPIAALALALPAYASHGRYNSHGFTVNIEDDDQNLTDCGQIHVTYDDRDVPMISESVPVSGLRSLRIRSDRNGGIHVTGGAGTLAVKACKASALGDARNIRVNLSGNEITADADREDYSVVYYIVSVPRGASLDLSANNGPISIQSVDGSVTASAHNGPISVKDSAGTLDISTQNGPISFAGDAGNVKLRATNGPISVRLAGGYWNSGSLDASTQNGPLSLHLPRGYRSGVLVESDGNGPVTCRAEACRDVRRFNDEGEDDRPRRIELGSGARAVTLSTNNGPIAVKED
jgi:DUF4097 and DUF4098 domain-containing protein YvlB